MGISLSKLEIKQKSWYHDIIRRFWNLFSLGGTLSIVDSSSQAPQLLPISRHSWWFYKLREFVWIFQSYGLIAQLSVVISFQNLIQSEFLSQHLFICQCLRGAELYNRTGLSWPLEKEINSIQKIKDTLLKSRNLTLCSARFSLLVSIPLIIPLTFFSIKV